MSVCEHVWVGVSVCVDDNCIIYTFDYKLLLPAEVLIIRAIRNMQGKFPHLPGFEAGEMLRNK